ncbi:MAG: PIN domain-containing protein [Rubrivivax sp.]|nr:PIN domain-containing protein [Rubrivivax sp.]
MLVVDSSVWIDFFNARRSPGREMLRSLLDQGEVRIVVPDLVLFEVLRGFRLERDLRTARALFAELSVEAALEPGLALEAAEHYRSLRARGHTVRSPIDVLLAAFCIDRDYALLHNDRDFVALAALRGLREWRQ